ncbi:MAG: hypothetical protein ACE5IR_02850 [bacterium]
MVFVVENGKAVQRTPRFGLESGEFTSVLEGLKAGEKVVILGQENLTHGTEVEVKLNR